MLLPAPWQGWGFPLKCFRWRSSSPSPEARPRQYLPISSRATGPDSLASRISAVIIGSAETTFYVLAVYLGAVGIRKTKYLVPVCIIADAIGIIVAIAVVRLMF